MRLWFLVMLAACRDPRDAPPDAFPEGPDTLVRLPSGVGYDEVPLADEQVPEHSTSYLRRDLLTAVQAAIAEVHADGAPVIEIGDGSERDGATPGTWAGRPRHPANTHLDGRDVDLAYVQRGAGASAIHAICDHVVEGVDQHHCVGPPVELDVERTARLAIALFASGHVRTIGVDGVAGGLLEAEMAHLGHPELHLAYELRDTGRGWFYGHHNHLHVSWAP